MNTPREKINFIIDIFGISTEVQAKAMNISKQSVYNKHNLMKDDFNEKNYLALKSYLIENLETIKNL